ncbi:cupin-like domain-containing protein [Chlorogloeopsis sp. ULAP01]|uniref:cupin-like domain-containing protein n=1 Tax=Chlorogloeopsis sp. ULAP01 TaxID=3056483 RepID=UPI0025AAAA4E|nr:cupin-like domain-containing protein [Chlorogloeopsis sp. ULAP01]MDM9379450.1 cupin-like domain-containing protein [Chlorogloeopsis sp. ULAP01]
MKNCKTYNYTSLKAKNLGVCMQIQTSESILKLKNPSKQEFSNKWKNYKPFVIEGVAKHWDACHKWSNDYLVQQCGNNIVNIQFYAEDFFDNYRKFSYEDGYDYINKDIPYKEYINNYVNKVNQNNNSDIRCYLPSAVFEKTFPELVADVTYPKYLNRKPLISFWHGLSSKAFSSTTVLHFDGFHNLFVQIRGKKRILLFPPSNYLSFYPPLEDSLGLADYSKVDPNYPNLELFPRFPWQDKIEVILQPGEILYIPPYWWHHVTALEENISLSFFYDVIIQDYFQQKNLLSVFLKIAPYYLYHAISSPDGMWTAIALLKSLIIPGSFTESIRQRNSQ